MATAPNWLENYELVEESGYVRHTCGHMVWWSLFPGVSNDFLRGVSQQPCPCCGGETGVVQEAIEWPAHVKFAKIGLAHCHRPWQSCESVEMKHRLGLVTVDNEGIEKLRAQPRALGRFPFGNGRRR